METAETLKNAEAFKNKERDYFFDNAKFFLILLVVFFHAVEFINCTGIISSAYRFVYLFHMPAFVFISGYFFKFQKSNKIARFVVLYVIFQAILMLIDRSAAFFYPLQAMWFLVAIVVWKLVAPFVVCCKARYTLPIAVIVALAVGYDQSVGMFFALSRIIVLFPFFLSGYYFKKEWITRLKQIKYGGGYICAALLLSGSFLVVAFLYGFNTEWVYYRQGYQAADGVRWYSFLIRLGFMLWGAVLTLCFLAVVPDRRLSVFSGMGRRTLQAYLLHIVILKLLNLIPIRDYVAGGWQTALYLSASLAAAVILLLPLPKLKLKRKHPRPT